MLCRYIVLNFGGMTLETTAKLAEFLVNTDYGDIPEKVKNIARRSALDTIGVSLAGTREICSTTFTGFIKNAGSIAEAGVIGKGFRTYAPFAGLANGIMAWALDYNDGGIKITHPSALSFPATITIADKLQASGKDVLTAYILALEVAGKVALGCNFSAGYKSISHFSFLGGLGSAAAVCKLLKLDVNRTRTAFGIVTNLASGLQSAAHGTWLSPTTAGNVAYNGITAALMAQEGFPANTSIIETEGGLCDTFVGPGNYDLNIMTSNLGNPFYIECPGVTIKKYPSCFLTHRVIEAALQMVQEHNINHSEIAEIQIGMTKRALSTLAYPEPDSGDQGRFSMPFCIASAIIDRKVNLGTFTDDKVREPGRKELMKKVRYYFPDLPIFSGMSQVDPARPPVGNPVAIRLKNGQSYSARMDILTGGPEAPLTDQEVISKYADCAGGILPPEKIERSAELILNLEQVKNFRKVMDIICAISK